MFIAESPEKRADENSMNCIERGSESLYWRMELVNDQGVIS